MQYLTLISLTFLVFSNTQTIQLSSQKTYFSGIIEYDVEFEVLNADDNLLYYYEQQYGDSMKLTFAQNGDYVKEYFGFGKYGREFVFYNQAENQFYVKNKMSDVITCFAGDGKDVFSIKKETSHTEETILGKKCQSVKFEGTVIAEGFPDKAVENIYWFSDNYKINKATHKGINEKVWQRFLDVSQGAYYLKHIMEYPSYRHTFTAKEAKETKILSIDSKVYLKDLPIKYTDF